MLHIIHFMSRYIDYFITAWALIAFIWPDLFINKRK